MKQLEIVLKIVERCNINCSYCYMFNMDDKTFNGRPPYMSNETAEQVVQFIKKGCLDLGIKVLIVSFHGGEPLMQKKESVKFFCELLCNELNHLVTLSLQLHTNAMLIDDEWLNIFVKYNIGVGVSIDGLKEQHDVYRKDKLGRGTYDRVIYGVKKLYQNEQIVNMGNCGILCVINPGHSAKEIYRHFVDDLNAKCIDFLLPHSNYSHPPQGETKAYGQYLLDIFNEWIKDDNPEIYVRAISSTLDVILGKNSHYMYGAGISDQAVPIISINSDGGITPTDEFRTMSPEMFYTNSSVNNISLKNFLDLPLFKHFNFAANNLAEKCQECKWVKICNGGSIVNRYSSSNNFDNPSIYCDALKMFYQEIFDYLSKGLPEYQITSKLGNTFSIEKGIS